MGKRIRGSKVDETAARVRDAAEHIEEQLEAGVEQARHSGRQVAHKARVTAKEATGKARDNAEEKVQQLERLGEKAVAKGRRRPVVTAVSAVAAGLVLGAGVVFALRWCHQRQEPTDVFTTGDEQA